MNAIDKHFECTEFGFDVSTKATLGDYARIVRWLSDVVGPEDSRGFDPTPLFRFACIYKLLHWEPENIYREYVRYQCHVYDAAGKNLSVEELNGASFIDLQLWFEKTSRTF